jgi:hypothetical protein
MERNHHSSVSKSRRDWKEKEANIILFSGLREGNLYNINYGLLIMQEMSYNINF